MIIFVISISFFSLLTILLCCLWIYNDCVSRDINPILWTILMIASTPILGFILYFIIERRNSIVSHANKRNNIIAIAIIISVILLISSSIGLIYSIYINGDMSLYITN